MIIKDTMRLNKDLSLTIYDCLTPSIRGGVKVLYMLKKGNSANFSYYVFGDLKDLLLYLLDSRDGNPEYENRDRTTEEPKYVRVDRLNLSDTSFINSLAKSFY